MSSGSPPAAPAGWRLEVADEGPGIPAADRDRVFERFGTLSGAEGGGGTGLGLAIARWVTDLHGGTHPLRRPRARAAPAPGSASTCRSSHPAARTPRRQEPAHARTAPRLPPPPHRRTPDRPSRSWTTLFGTFWPERRRPGDVRAVLGALGVGLLAAIVLPFRDLGLGTFVVLLAAGAVILAAQRRTAGPRSPWPAPRSACCWRPPSRAPGRGVDRRPVPAGRRAVCMAGLVNGAHACRRFVLAGIAWPLAGLRGLRGWVARARGHRRRQQRGGAAHGRLVAAGCARLRPAVRLGRRALRRVGGRGRPRPGARLVRAAGVHHCRRRRCGAGGDVPRAEPAHVEPAAGPVAAGRPPLRVAGPGAARRRCLPGVPGRAGHGHLRRARLPRAHHRAHLRGVRAPGLRPAHGRHRAHAARGVGGRPQGAARDRRPTGLAARVARPALRADPGRGRLRALPDARLPGGLRLHPSSACWSTSSRAGWACWCSA